MDKAKLAAVLSYLVQSEYMHYLESDRDSDHIYVKALDCLNELCVIILNERGLNND